MKKRSFQFLLIISTLLFLVGCADLANQIVGNTPTAVEPTATQKTAEPEATATDAEPVAALAPVDSVEVLIAESFPVQVSVRARGELPDGCTEIDQINTAVTGTTYNVTITTLRPADALCTEAVVPFEEVVSLDVEGLPAGTYTVNVNGINASFTLDADNFLSEENPTETAAEATPAGAPTPTDEPDNDSNSALINGRVWHDVCAVTGEGEAAVPSAGCASSADGASFFGNGLLEDGEPGLENVVVSLGEGSCPSVGLAETETDADGDYIFEELAAGEYCVSIDTEAEENSSLLPGEWTYPGIGQTAVTLTDGEIKTEVNFGWDFELLPVSEVNLEDCTNSIAFVDDLTFPDDTVVAPGTEFEKGWMLKNTGTCPWTTQYSLVFAGGDQMSAPQTITLTTAVAPDQEIAVYAPFIAPEVEGTYRSDWLMADSAGNIFGVDGFDDQVFWAQIVVGVPEPTAEPNSGVIGGVVWEDICFIDSDGDPSAGCVEIEGTNFYRGDGTLINEPRLVGVTVVLAEGACPDDSSPDASSILETTLTDEQGLYRFTNLDEGLYCVAIDALSPANVDLLIPGNWTWPAPGTGRYGINLSAGGEFLEVDFGWDYQE